MSITLPPLPQPTLIADTPSGHTAAYSPAQLRARDLEVAKCVLEAAAKACIAHDLIVIPNVYEIAAIRKCAKAIRELEIKHG